ncbi:hypothetical protein FHY55_08540 [Oceanicola sp. D3]|nr:hypothetical protein FHY55_08540 [Oceanicola sp. D3]
MDENGDGTINRAEFERASKLIRRFMQ